VTETDPRAWLADLRQQAQQRAAAGLRRELRPRTADLPMLDLAGNDYLGLSKHPAVIEAAAAAARAYGTGSTGSRLVRGSTDLHEQLEQELARFIGTEAALVYSSGFLANLGVVRALVTSRTVLVVDAHVHASLVDGCRLSKAPTVVTPHSDLGAIRDALAAHAGRPAVVIAESIYSVDGDLAPLRELHAICREWGAILLVDDAHAIGVIGRAGIGGVASAGLAGEPDVVITATLSKSLGAGGGVVLGPAELRTHLVDTGRTFIYDTALAPATTAAALTALSMIPAADDKRVEIAARRGAITAMVTTQPRFTPAGGVASLPARNADEAVAWAQACRDQGVAVGCFRPPSTPDGSSRLRLTINAGIPREDFDHALGVIKSTQP
jgi:8-amino-7-oxononanoate synthase